MKAAVLRAFGQTPRWEDFPEPMPGDGEELVEVTAAPLNNIDRVRADGSHYSVRSGDYGPGGLPAVPGMMGAGRLASGTRVLFAARTGAMAQYSVARHELTFPIPDSVDDAVAAAAWNPGLTAWLTFGWRCPLEPGQTVLILGATGVAGQLAVQAARHFGAARIVAAGRNQRLLARLPALGADATIQLAQPAAALRAAFAAEAGAGGYDVVADYLWGRPAEVFLSAIERHDAVPRSGRVRMIQLGDMAGPAITLSAAVLRSSGVELTGGGSGTMPPAGILAAMLAELLDLLGSGRVTIGIERVPLASIGDVWARDQQGRRPVFIP